LLLSILLKMVTFSVCFKNKNKFRIGYCQTRVEVLNKITPTK